jgi:hypothetical protein
MPTTTMTIGQALRKIKNIKGEIKIAENLALANIVYLENERPKATFSSEWQRRGSLVDQLIKLQATIAESNALTQLEITPGVLVSRACLLRMLEEIKGTLAIYEKVPTSRVLFPEHSNTRILTKEVHEDIFDAQGKYTGQRVIEKEYTQTHICELTSEELRENIRQLKNSFERLNNLLEESNHKTVISVDL